MAISFDSTTLSDSPYIESMTASAKSFRVTIGCMTASRTKTTMETLYGKFGGIVNRRILCDGEVSLQGPGTKGTLVIGDDTYTNCMITDFKIRPPNKKATSYGYTITFERDTSS
jgi:hypothetical protein